MATRKKLSDAELSKQLANWTTTNEFLRGASEDAAGQALAYERGHKRRTMYMLRIHARFNKMRAERERGELLSLAVE